MSSGGRKTGGVPARRGGWGGRRPSYYPLASTRFRYARAIEEGLAAREMPAARMLKDMTQEERDQVVAALGAPLSKKAKL